MRRSYLYLSILSILISGCVNSKDIKVNKHTKMQMFQSVSPTDAKILQEGEQKNSCSNCGMNLPTFFKTNHVAKVDGKVKQFCSIHCLAKSIKDGAKVENIKVVDTKTLKFIDAKKAYYVVGSKKKGTMSGVSKYAFAKKDDALAFAKQNGGEVMSFEKALEVAKKDFK
jgi:nitrous oxide reductase accessory protein NosL